MNSVSGNRYVRNVLYGSFKISLALTMWNRGWYLCIELSMVCRSREGDTHIKRKKEGK